MSSGFHSTSTHEVHLHQSGFPVVFGKKKKKKKRAKIWTNLTKKAIFINFFFIKIGIIA